MTDAAGPTTVGLFCGAGGADLGLHAAGYRVRVGADHDRDALRTYRRALPGRAVRANLRRVDPAGLPIDPADVAHVHASPPCPGFSPASGERDAGDPRNTLVWRFVDWCHHLQPRTLTMENVPGMLSITDGWMHRLTDRLADAGYRVAYDVLTAADYGVAQTRRRVFVVGVREDVPAPGLGQWFPPPTHSEAGTNGTAPWRTVRDVIGDLAGEVAATKTQGVTSISAWRGPDEPSGTIGAHSTDCVAADGGAPPAIVPSQDYGHWAAGRRDADSVDAPSATVRTRPPTLALANHDPSGDAYDPDPDKRDAYQARLDRPATTVTAGAPYLDQGRRERDGGGDPRPTSEYERRIRRLTVRECARLQSVPDWVRFVGTKTSQYQQVGNAVPPRLMFHVGRHLREVVYDD